MLNHIIRAAKRRKFVVSFCTFEPHQYRGNVVGFSTTAGESQRFGCSGGVGTYQHLGDGP